MTLPTQAAQARLQAVRADFAAQLAAYRNLVAAASKASGMSLTRIDGALAAFEPGYFNHLLIALDARLAALPRPVAGACAELRVLCDSLVAHGGVLTVPPGTAYAPAATTLRIDAGDRIALHAEDFETISQAVLDAVAQAAGR